MLSGTIYNGVADWLYEEEILGTDTALWPHAASLAFLSFNDTEVEAGTRHIVTIIQGDFAVCRWTPSRCPTSAWASSTGSTSDTRG